VEERLSSARGYMQLTALVALVALVARRCSPFFHGKEYWRQARLNN
jgi:hypothetical protein